MRTRAIAIAVAAIGLVAIPSLVRADRAPEQRSEVQTVSHERHGEVRENRVVEHVQRGGREEHRDVRVHERVEIEHGRDRDWDRGRDRDWDHDRVRYIPAAVETVEVAAEPFCNVPVGIDQVPPAVLNATAARTGGAPIVSVWYLHVPGGRYYDVRVIGPYRTIQTLRFGINGGFYGYRR